MICIHREDKFPFLTTELRCYQKSKPIQWNNPQETGRQLHDLRAVQELAAPRLRAGRGGRPGGHPKCNMARRRLLQQLHAPLHGLEDQRRGQLQQEVFSSEPRGSAQVFGLLNGCGFSGPVRRSNTALAVESALLAHLSSSVKTSRMRGSRDSELIAKKKINDDSRVHRF